MKTSDIETKFGDAFFSGEYDPELYAEFFGLQDSEKEPAKETATQTQTKTVTRGTYNRVPVGNGQFRHVILLLLTMENMKQTLKAMAAIVGIVVAVVILNYFIKALGCLMIYISETCNVPL